MIDLVLIAVLLLGFFVAWNIGANDAADSVGVSVGARILTYRRAIMFVIIFALIGAVLEGWKNMGTVGKGIIIPGPGHVNPLSAVPLATIALLIAAGIWMFVMSTLGLPISVTQSMVGAVMGAGLLITFMRPDLGASVQFSKLGTIAISWLCNPIIAAIFGFTLFKIVGASLRRIKSIFLLNRVFSILVLTAAAYGGYTLGANDLGTCTGVLHGYGVFGGVPQIISLFGIVGLAIGAITYSRRVIQTVGSGITGLGPASAFASQFGAALAVWIFVQFRIPVSSSQALIGAIAGAGLVKGAETVNKEKLGHIGIVWVFTPGVTLLLSFAIGWLLLSLFPV